MKQDSKALTTMSPSQNALPLDGHPELDEGAPVPVKTARRVSSKTNSQAQGVPSPNPETAAVPCDPIPQLKLERTSLRTWSFTGPEGAVTRALAIKKLTQLAAGAGAAGVGGSLLHETVVWISGVITIGAMTFIFILGVRKP